eukprot:5524419-Ditylum_brightwellii.AAC.1
MEPMLYSSLSTTAYNAPSAPTRTTLPGNASSQQIQEAVEDVYIHQLCHKYSAYLGVTARDVLGHLMDWYRQIKPANLVAN